MKLLSFNRRRCFSHQQKKAERLKKGETTIDFNNNELKLSFKLRVIKTNEIIAWHSNHPTAITLYERNMFFINKIKRRSKSAWAELMPFESVFLSSSQTSDTSRITSKAFMLISCRNQNWVIIHDRFLALFLIMALTDVEGFLTQFFILQSDSFRQH